MRLRGCCFGLLAWLCAQACSTSGPKVPEPSSVSISLTGLAQAVPADTVDASALPASAVDGGTGSPVTLMSPLRYAIVWEVYDFADPGNLSVRPIETADEPVPAIDQPFPVSLVMPPAEAVKDLAYTEEIRLANQSLPVFFPRIVIYEDVDQSASFTRGASNGTGDRVLGIAYQATEIAAVLDLENLLKAMPLDSAYIYYAASGGRYTPFVAVTSGWYATPWQPLLSLVLDGWSYSDVAPACLRMTASKGIRSSYYQIDTAAPTTCAEAALGPNLAGCQVVTLQAITAPAIEALHTLRLRRTARCAVGAGTQLLIVSESGPSDAPAQGSVPSAIAGVCTTPISIYDRIYVASSSALPTWWPCGITIPF
jgi:hypothetical protein